MENLNAQPQVDITKTVAVKCDECMEEAFEQALFLRKVPRLLTGAAKDGYIPIPVFACTACGHINQEFIPKELSS